MYITLSWFCLSIYAVGWVALAAAPMRYRFCWVFARSCAVALAISYCLFVLLNFGNIPSWQALLQSDIKISGQILPGMSMSALHILAFNLFIGSWQVEDAPQHQLPHMMILPCLLVTAIGGPLGFVLHILARDIWKSKLRRGVPL